MQNLQPVLWELAVREWVQSLRLYHCLCPVVRRWSARDDGQRAHHPHATHRPGISPSRIRGMSPVSVALVRRISPPGPSPSHRRWWRLSGRPLAADHHVSVAARFLLCDRQGGGGHGHRPPALATSTLPDESRIQLQIADAEASLRSARAFLYDALQDVWNATESGRPVTTKESAILRLACVHATRAACEAVDFAYHAAGSVSLLDASPLQRALRDVHAVRQHMMVADRYRQDAGRVLLGLEPKESLF